MADEKPPRIQVTKIGTARTQIETAVVLWFNDGDVVSINTLTAAAHQVCKNLCKRLKIPVRMIYDESNVAFNGAYLSGNYQAIVERLEPRQLLSESSR